MLPRRVTGPAPRAHEEHANTCYGYKLLLFPGVKQQQRHAKLASQHLPPRRSVHDD
jgi:hypothetical protein